MNVHLCLCGNTDGVTPGAEQGTEGHVLCGKETKCSLLKKAQRVSGQGLLTQSTRCPRWGLPWGDCSMLTNHFHLVHCKEWSRKPLTCGPEAGKEMDRGFQRGTPAPPAGHSHDCELSRALLRGWPGGSSSRFALKCCPLAPLSLCSEADAPGCVGHSQSTLRFTLLDFLGVIINWEAWWLRWLRLPVMQETQI